MREDQFDNVARALRAQLEKTEGPVQAGEILDALEQDGYDSAEISFVIADLVNHGELPIDARQRLELAPVTTG